MIFKNLFKRVKKATAVLLEPQRCIGCDKGYEVYKIGTYKFHIGEGGGHYICDNKDKGNK